MPDSERRFRIGDRKQPSSAPIVYPEEHKMKLARIPSLFLAAVIVTVAVAPSYAQRRVLVLSWNVESGDNETATIVKQLEDFEGFDILGLTEVKFSNATDYADAAEVGEGAKSSSSSDFRHVVSSSGAGDRMMIIWDNKRFEKIGNKTELTSFNDGTTNHQLNDGNHRSPMFCNFKIRGTNIEFLFMVNHLARGNTNLRNKQATGLKAWVMAQELPVIAVGDWNFDYDIDDGEGNQAFKNLLADDVWKWARPQRLH